MSRILKNKHNGQRGSVTVEAAIAFTGFLFVIFTILGVINVCRVQMLVSSALDTAAKEMAQYSYFYKMSGLQKFSKDLSAQADVGKDKVNDVVGSLDDLISTVVSAKDGSVEDVTNLANATSKGTVTYEDFEKTINGIKENGSNVMSGVTEVEAKFKDVAANPMTYVRSLVAIAGESGLDMAKSRMLAVPLGRMFFQKHFGDSAEEASETLERLGVVDGLEGMNFNMSTLFDSDHPEDIRLAVYYKVKMINFLSSEDFTLNFCKQATVRGWLAGDNPIVKVKKTTTTTGGDTTKEGGETTEEGGEDTETTPTEETSEPSTEATEAPVDTEGSYWHMSDAGGYTSEQQMAFELKVKQDYQLTYVGTYGVGVQLQGVDAYGRGYGMTYITSAEDIDSFDIYTAPYDAINTAGMAYTNNNGTTGLEPGTVKQYTTIIYVPENISDEEIAAIEKAIYESRADAMKLGEDQSGITLDSIGFQIVRSGGNYDYGSEG